MNRIILLDDNADLLELMAELLKDKLGIDSLCFSRLSDFASNETEVLNAKMAILDINLGPGEPSGVDAYRWLQNRRFVGKIIFLTAHASSNTLVAEALNTGIEILQKPLAAEKIVAIVKEAVFGVGVPK